MSLAVVTAGSGDSSEPISTPYEVSIGIVNNGSGGSLFMTSDPNGPGGSFNPKTFFGVNFKSYPFIAYFNKGFFASDTVAAKEFTRDYRIAIVPILAGNVEPLPNFTLTRSNGYPMIIFQSAATAGAAVQLWRLQIWLKNSSGK